MDYRGLKTREFFSSPAIIPDIRMRAAYSGLTRLGGFEYIMRLIFS